MKNIILAAIFAISATTVFASDISKPVMDPEVVASTMDAVPSSYNSLWFVLSLIAIAVASSK